MDDEEASVIMFANLRGSREKPSGILKFAQACRLYTTKMKSYNKVADFFKVSRTMISQIDKINDLTSDAKKLIQEAGIDRSFQASRLPPSKQAPALREMMTMNANPEARLFVDYLIENKAFSVSDAKERFLKTLPKKERIHIVAIPLREATYLELRNIASSQKQSVRDLIVDLSEACVSERTKEKTVKKETR